MVAAGMALRHHTPVGRRAQVPIHLGDEEINGTKETLTDVLLAMVMMVLDTWLCCFGTTMFLFALGLGILVVSNFLFYDFMLSLLLLKETSSL